MGHKNSSIGAVEHFHTFDNGIEGKTDLHRFKLTVYNEHIFRVQLSKESQFDENPYSVVLTPGNTRMEIQETDEAVTVASGQLRCIIQKKPLRVRFENNREQLLNEEDRAFGTSWIGEEVTSYRSLQPDEIFLGLGEKTGTLNRRGASFTNWNTDAFSYGNNSDPLYVSTPFYIGVTEGRPYGIFFDNTRKTHFNFGASSNQRFSSFSAEGGDMNYYFIQGDTVADIIKQYSCLTGTIQLPPLWSLGFQQCRYSYYPDFEVKTIANTFRDKKIPADVIYLDIHYMKEYKAFTFDEERFPDPKALIRMLEEKGFKVVVILDPGIKTEEGYETYQRGIEEDIFIKYPDGTRYEACVWPGNSHFTDFTSNKGRNWWAKELEFYTDLGLEGFWNDMNEPACWGQDIPHLIEFDYEGEQVTHKKARNIYGFQMVRSTFEGARKQLDNKRPFTLTRSGYSGVQRYSAVWTGDNVAGEEDMLLGVRLVNSLGMTGIPVAGYDVGGFAGESSPALYARWLAVAAFAPFFRVHSMVNSRDSEPWAYGEEVEEISRNYINLRYQMLPYIYTVFHEASRTGMPINRSLAIAYTDDLNIYHGNAENEFTLGEWLLVCPTVSTQDFAQVYLPEGEWYHFFTDEKHIGAQHLIVTTGMEELPVFAKAGAIIPMQSKVQFTSDQNDGILRLHVYHGKVMTNQNYYEDDGESYDFEKGGYYERMIEFDGLQKLLTLSERRGDYKSKFDILRIYFHGFNEKSFEVNGNAMEANKEDLTLLDPITAFDPLPEKEPKHFEIKELSFIETPFSDEVIEVRWS